MHQKKIILHFQSRYLIFFQSPIRAMYCVFLISPHKATFFLFFLLSDIQIVSGCGNLGSQKLRLYGKRTVSLKMTLLFEYRYLLLFQSPIRAMYCVFIISPHWTIKQLFFVLSSFRHPNRVWLWKLFPVVSLLLNAIKSQ